MFFHFWPILHHSVNIIWPVNASIGIRLSIPVECNENGQFFATGIISNCLITVSVALSIRHYLVRTNYKHHFVRSMKAFSAKMNCTVRRDSKTILFLHKDCNVAWFAMLGFHFRCYWLKPLVECVAKILFTKSFLVFKAIDHVFCLLQLLFEFGHVLLQ